MTEASRWRDSAACGDAHTNALTPVRASATTSAMTVALRAVVASPPAHHAARCSDNECSLDGEEGGPDDVGPGGLRVEPALRWRRRCRDAGAGRAPRRGGDGSLGVRLGVEPQARQQL